RANIAPAARRPRPADRTPTATESRHGQRPRLVPQRPAPGRPAGAGGCPGRRPGAAVRVRARAGRGGRLAPGRGVERVAAPFAGGAGRGPARAWVAAADLLRAEPGGAAGAGRRLRRRGGVLDPALRAGDRTPR